MRIRKADMYCNVENKIAHIVINRSPANLFTENMFMQLKTISNKLQELIETDEVRAVVVSSALTKMFCGGIELTDVPDKGEAVLVQNNLAVEAFESIRKLPVYVIVAVTGIVQGAGFALVMCGDYCIASDEASFRMGDANLGMFPRWGVLYEMSKRCDPALLKRVLVTGERFGSKFSMRLGVVQETVADDMTLSHAMEMAKVIADRAPMAVQAQKELVDAGSRGISQRENMALENKHTLKILVSEDLMEGLEAYADQRKPLFRNK